MASYSGHITAVVNVTPSYSGHITAVVEVTPSYSGHITAAVEVTPSYSGDITAIVEVTPSYSGDITPIVYVGCFPKTELVYTSVDKYVPIGSIKLGDKLGFWDITQKKTKLTEVTAIHQYKVKEIICLNKAMLVSFSHPLLVVECDENGIFMPKWKVAYDVNVGDCVVGAGGKCITIKSKSNHYYKEGIEVLNFSTDCGLPFIVGGCVVRAENATDSITWADAPITQKLLVA